MLIQAAPNHKPHFAGWIDQKKRHEFSYSKFDTLDSFSKSALSCRGVGFRNQGARHAGDENALAAKAKGFANADVFTQVSTACVSGRVEAFTLANT